MTTIFQRIRRATTISLAGVLVTVGLALLLAWLVMAVWVRGGPQPLHRIVIAIPAPQMPATGGGRA